MFYRYKKIWKGQLWSSCQKTANRTGQHQVSSDENEFCHNPDSTSTQLNSKVWCDKKMTLYQHHQPPPPTQTFQALLDELES